ncbi:MAG: preprotein translocase subunit SecA [Chloroflexi bacterium]|nr:preprotein translocase subunit SecA [Chloroflexota bacterium]MCL5026200.1 preprotein translocase subunit SecA [Chloroflexota bacterium]
MLKWATRLLGGDPNGQEIGKLWPVVRAVEEMEPATQALADDQFRDKTTELRGRYLAGEELDDMLMEAFALVREASRRAIGLRHYPVQLMGGIVLHQGKISEMKTGEGKTLVATLPLYLNALAGQGAHLVTVNDYLAKRDAQWMGPIYHMLGLTVGVIQHESAFQFDPSYAPADPRYLHLRPVSRAEAYACDITYGTNNEFGFDYLRDNMVVDPAQCVQREMHYAIVDEVDNILVDEARTPLIISGQGDQSTDKYYLFARMVPRLTREADYKIDEKTKTVTLTEEGIAKLEKWLGLPNLYDPANYELTHYLEQALKAEFIFKRDRDYVLYKDGQVISYRDREAEIVIVDEFTGRLMLGRRYSEGLHQAIEAKEGVRIRRESQTLATITFQNYFRMYEKLAGMTGTAYTEREEFYKIYNLDVIVIPTHKPMIRADMPDLVYKSGSAKFNAVVEEIVASHEKGRPVLVGTVSIERSEQLSEMLKRKHIPHQVLNAKYHEREAAIIAQAGRPGTVTIATNMAGRGVDILLGGNPAGMVNEYLQRQGADPSTAAPEHVAAARREAEQQCAIDKEKVVALGGLHIVGTERHEARRIDNQLRGRSGRQGDPGSSRFYVALDDELMRRFGGSNIAGLMDRFGLEDDVPIEHAVVSKAIENAQTKVEGYNFDIRKHVVEYDDVMNKQREVIYGEREKILSQESMKEPVQKMIADELTSLVDVHLPGPHRDDWDLEAFIDSVQAILPVDFSQEQLEKMSRDEIEEFVQQVAEGLYEQREQEQGAEDMRHLERLVMLTTIDRQWVEHLTAIDDLREGIGLRAYGQRDPLVEYKNEAYRAFQELLASIQRSIVHTIYHVNLTRAPEPAPPQKVWANRAADEAPEPARVGRKIGRNDPCPCGSGKKYKKCCGR